MRLSYLNYSKLSRPELPTNIVHRSRLLHQIAPLAEIRLALLCADAGYGKTTLLLDFLRAWPYPALWYRLDRTDRDVDQFTTYLLEGFSETFPDLDTLIGEQKGEWSGLKGTFRLRSTLLHNICRVIQRPYLMVLDGFERVADSPEVCSLVSDLLECSGSKGHIVIASRVIPHLPIVKLIMRQDALVFRSEDLAFTLEESRELLINLNVTFLTEEQMDVLWQYTEGWPAGLILTVNALHSGSTNAVMAGFQDPFTLPKLVQWYFECEVFSEQDTTIQQFLAETSLLSKLSRNAVNDLIKINNGGDILDILREAGVFVRNTEDGGGDLRYHHLFRHFLLQKLRANHGDDHLRQLYRRAGNIACRNQCWSDAVGYYAAAWDWGRVETLMQREGNELTRRGLLETTQRWLDLIPEDQIARRPRLLMLRGRLMRLNGRYYDALRDLDKALEVFRSKNDQEGAAWAELESAVAYYCLAEFHKAEEITSDVLCRAGNNPTLRSYILTHLSVINTASGELQKAARLGEMAATESISSGSDIIGTIALARALRFRGRALILQGDIQQGLEDIGRSVDLSRAESLGDLETAWSLFTLGQSFTLQGAFDRACLAFNEAESLAHGSHELLSSLYLWRGTAYRDSGTFNLAEHDYWRAGRGGQRELAFLRLRQGRIVEGLHLAKESLRFYSAREQLYERVMCQTVYGISLAAHGDLSSGIRELVASAKIFRDAGRRQQLAGVQWHLARWMAESGRQAEALEHLKSAILWASAKGLYHLWWWDPETVARLWPLAYGEGLVPAYLLEIARLRLGPQECRFLYEALGKVPPADQEQLINVLRTVSGGSLVVHNTVDVILRSCLDPNARSHIAMCLASGALTPEELIRLRKEVGLSWRELEIFTRYYLNSDANQNDNRFRFHLARELGISEYTLKVHIRNLRRKLALKDRRHNVRRTSPTA